MRILVTGGSGFIGTNLVEHYLRTDTTVCNLDISAPRNPAHRPLWNQVDLMDKSGLRRAVKEFGPTHLCHLAARTNLYGSAAADYAVNTEGLSNLIEVAALQPGLSRVIFASSRMVCRIGYQPQGPHDYCPSTAYGASKAEGEKRVYQSSESLPEWLIVRPTSIWGPWFDVPYRTFFDAVAQGRYFHPLGRRILKSFGYVGNTVIQLERLMTADRAKVHQQMFYLCDNPPLEVYAFAELVRKAFGAKYLRSVPTPVLRTMAMCGDLLQLLGMRNPPLTQFRLDNLLTEMIHDTAALDAVCGAPLYSLADGVARTASWMRSDSQE